MRPGDSITGGINLGITDCDVFILLWSSNAKESGWIDTELRAALRRRVDDSSLRVVPLTLDETPLPTLVADYCGFDVTKYSDLQTIARQIVGDEDALDTAVRLQRRTLELIANEFPETDSIRSLICSSCASDNLTPNIIRLRMFDETIYEIVCGECGCVCRSLAHGPNLEELERRLDELNENK